MTHNIHAITIGYTWIREDKISPAPMVTVAGAHKHSYKMADAIEDSTVMADSLTYFPSIISVSWRTKHIGRSLEIGFN